MCARYPGLLCSMPSYRYRIFTNDRGTLRGVPMYSALKEVTAANAIEACAKCPVGFGPPTFGPVVAIRWPADVQTDSERAWIAKHV